jgi:hypothetical protein
VEYLAGIAAAARVRVEVVRTPTDLGIPDAIKEGINRARGEYLVLLNNEHHCHRRTLACARDCFVHHFGTRTFAHGAVAGSKDARV